jgi:hypothetical protein
MVLESDAPRSFPVRYNVSLDTADVL